MEQLEEEELNKSKTPEGQVEMRVNKGRVISG